MKLTLLDYLTDIREYDGVAISGDLRCTCGQRQFAIQHTGKQTKGIFSPYIVRKEKQLTVKAICTGCSRSITLYRSGTDRGDEQPFQPFTLPRSSGKFSIRVKYNYRPENLKTDCFENCFLYLLSDDGEEGKALIEE